MPFIVLEKRKRLLAKSEISLNGVLIKTSTVTNSNFVCLLANVSRKYEDHVSNSLNMDFTKF